MQIRDIILNKRVAVKEGVFDTLKAAATWEPGETFAQAKAKVKNDAGVQKVAQKAQAAWQNYERQMQQYVATLPAPQARPSVTGDTTKSQGPTPGRRIKVSYQYAGQAVPSFYYKTSTGWTNELGKAVTDPKSIQALDALATKSGKEEPDPNYKEPGAEQTKKRRGSRRRMEEQATTTALDAYKNRSDGKYEQALKGFVQQNLLAGMPYARLQNAQEIDQLINTMSKPENANPKTQTPLWQQLAQATAVAAIVPQSAGGAGPNPTDNKQGGEKNQQGQTAEELLEPVKQFMAQNNIDMTKPGQLLRSQFNNNEKAIGSTGNPNVDAMLMAMGFTI